MIDTHSHILWGLDDGPPALDASLAMLRIAKESGMDAIVATPHDNDRWQYNAAIVAERLRELRSTANDLIPVYTGCEFRLTASSFEIALAHPTSFTINHGKYLLVELPEFSLPPLFDDVLRRLRAAGITPIVAHPERNTLLQHAPERIQRWVDLGCAMQITGQTLDGRFGKAARQFAWSMLCSNLVHLIASDAHDTEDRPPRLDTTRELIAAELGDDVATVVLAANPLAVLESSDLITIDVPHEVPQQRKSWFHF